MRIDVITITFFSPLLYYHITLRPFLSSGLVQSTLEAAYGVCRVIFVKVLFCSRIIEKLQPGDSEAFTELSARSVWETRPNEEKDVGQIVEMLLSLSE